MYRGSRVCCELGQSDPRFFLTRRCRRCRRVADDGSSMLSRIRQLPSTPLFFHLIVFLIVFVVRYVCTFERDVLAEGEESSRRESRGFMGFMGWMKGSLFGIIVSIFPFSMFWQHRETEFLMSLLFRKNNHKACRTDITFLLLKLY